ncbi:hypothetical protein DdX_05137 [Ditylenchus destructor]|uniref:Uncharacterized protein n=1 Tax=Ditylenchus destructor TaxID=166010 RepID=A0AAD4N7K9_9BILA|nr:hypothetical protein DdX_05137 [Ditylenchus destructor]
MGLVYSRGSTEKQTSKTFAESRAELSFEAELTPKDESCVEYITEDSDVEEIIASFLTDDDTALSQNLSSIKLSVSSSNTFLSSETSLNCSDQLSTTQEPIHNRIEADKFSIPEERLHRTEFSIATDLSWDRSNHSECSIYGIESSENMPHVYSVAEYSQPQQEPLLETERSRSSTNTCKTTSRSVDSHISNNFSHSSNQIPPTQNKDNIDTKQHTIGQSKHSPSKVGSSERLDKCSSIDDKLQSEKNCLFEEELELQIESTLATNSPLISSRSGHSVANFENYEKSQHVDDSNLVNSDGMKGHNTSSASSSACSEQDRFIYKSSINTCDEIKEHNSSLSHQTESSIDSDTLSDTSGTIPHAKRKRNSRNIKQCITRNKNANSEKSDSATNPGLLCLPYT